MVAGYHGKHIHLDSVRDLHGLAGHGVTFKDLLQIAGHLQLTARPLRLPISDLRRLKLPAILHWEMTHFVVLVRCGWRHYVIHDPATGRRSVGKAEMHRDFTGVALELTPQRDFRGRSERSHISPVRSAISIATWP